MCFGVGEDDVVIVPHLDRRAAWGHLPPLLIFYLLQYALLNRHLPEWAPWIAILTANLIEEAAELGCRACATPGGGCQFLGTAASSQVVGEAPSNSCGVK